MSTDLRDRRDRSLYHKYLDDLRAANFEPSRRLQEMRICAGRERVIQNWLRDQRWPSMIRRKP